MAPIATKATTLFSLDAVKTWCKVTGPDSSEDPRLVIVGDAASEEIEQETSMVFVKRSLSFVLNGTGKCAFALPVQPIVSIDSFTINGSPVAPSTYVLDTDLGIVTFTGTVSGFSAGVKNVAVTVTAGYDAQDGPSLPRDVYRAGLDLAKAIWDELSTGAIAATSVHLGASTMVIKAAKRPPSVQRVIDTWRAVRV